MMAQREESVMLLVHCHDRKGIVARVTGFIDDFGRDTLVRRLMARESWFSTSSEVVG